MAFLRSVFPFVAALTAAARPINNGPVLLVCWDVDGVEIPNGENADVSVNSAVKDNRAICNFIIVLESEKISIKISGDESLIDCRSSRVSECGAAF